MYDTAILERPACTCKALKYCSFLESSMNYWEFFSLVILSRIYWTVVSRIESCFEWIETWYVTQYICLVVDWDKNIHVIQWPLIRVQTWHSLSWIQHTNHSATLPLIVSAWISSRQDMNFASYMYMYKIIWQLPHFPNATAMTKNAEKLNLKFKQGGYAKYTCTMQGRCQWLETSYCLQKKVKNVGFFQLHIHVRYAHFTTYTCKR